MFAKSSVGAVAVAILILAVWSADGNVIGIDLGSEYAKVALVKPGVPLEVVLNVESRRKTPANVAFYDSAVLVGDPALKLGSKAPEHAGMTAFQQVLGQPVGSAMVRHAQELNTVLAVADEATPWGGVRFAATPEIETGLTVEESTSLLFRYLAGTASDFAGVDIKDTVITVPAFFSAAERRAVLDAAQLAKLRVLALINENTAVALNYAMGKVINATADEPKRVLFYDMGSGSTTATVVDFYAKTVKYGYKNKKEKTVTAFDVKGVAYDRTLGGKQFDALLVEIMADQVNAAQSDFDVREHARAMGKLQLYATKVKEVLSANTEYHTSYESLVGDYDYRGMVTRDEFEAAAAELLARVAAPIRSVLSSVGAGPADMAEVVLVGGGSRIPRIQQIMLEYLGRETLDKNINADEAAVLGATFHGGRISTSFRVKEIHANDVLVLPIGVTYPDADSGEPNQVTLFPAMNKVDSKKSMTFVRDNDFEFDVAYTEPDSLADAAHASLGTYAVTGVADAIAEAAPLITEGTVPKIKVSFHLSAESVVSVTRAVLYVNQTVPVTAPAADTDADADAGPNADADAEAETETDADAGTETDAEADADTDADVDPAATTTTKMVKIPLTVTQTTPPPVAGMTSSDFVEARATLKAMFDADAAKRERAEAKNALESFCYSTKERLWDEDIEEVTTEEERDGLREQLSEVSEWLYDEGWDETTEVYKAKLRDLKDLTTDMTLRADEMKTRGEAVERLRSLLALGTESLAKWEAETARLVAAYEDPRLSEADLDGLREQLNRTSSWMDEKESEQAELAPTDNPAFLTASVDSRAETLYRKLTWFKRKPMPTTHRKPKPVPPAPPVPEDDPDANDPPVFTSRPSAEGRVNDTYRFDVNVTDVDDSAEELELEASTLPSWADFVAHGNGSATLSGTPDKTGHHPIDLLVRDPSGANSTFSYFVYVRRAIVLKPKKQASDDGGDASGESADGGDGGDGGDGADGGEGGESGDGGDGGDGGDRGDGGDGDEFGGESGDSHDEL